MFWDNSIITIGNGQFKLYGSVWKPFIAEN